MFLKRFRACGSVVLYFSFRFCARQPKNENTQKKSTTLPKAYNLATV
jgi:hypothetical protein